MVKKAKQKENAKRKKAAAKKPVVSTATVNKPVAKTGNFDKVYGNQKTSFWKEPITFLQKRPALVVLILFLILGAGFFTYNQYQIYQEKQDFNKAEVVLDELASEIATQLGEPLNSEKEKYCSYRSVKTGDPGPPACSVSVNYHYDIGSVNNEFIYTLNKILTERIGYNPDTIIDNYIKGNRSTKNYISNADLWINDNSLNCYVSIYKTYDDSAELRASCGVSDSLKEHFPVKN